MQTRSGRASVALASGGLLAFLVHMLHLTALHQADGSVLGVPWDYYARWSILPFVLVMYGLVGLHRHQEDRYGKLGWLGFRITFLGYSMLVVGGIWSEVLFPPRHPLRFLGGLMTLLSLWVVSAGWGVWGGASWGSRSLPRWAASIPWVVALVWLGFRFPLHDFFSGIFWGGEGPFRYAVHALALSALSVILWREDEKTFPASTQPLLNRT